MAFKKIKYNTGSEIFETKVRDTSGAVIGNWVIMKENFMEWVELMKRKYGIKNKPRIFSQDEDLAWMQ